jgi:tetratricopeptide (TPR) repeat protein
MLTKSLEIYEKLRHLEGMAHAYGSLGEVYRRRGDAEKAREYWEKALALFKKIGMKAKIAKTQQTIDGLKDK